MSCVQSPAGKAVCEGLLQPLLTITEPLLQRQWSRSAPFPLQQSSLKEPASGSWEAEEQNRPGLECCFEIYTSIEGSPAACTLGIRHCS